MKHNKKCRGFTLIELITALSIVAVLVLLATPSFLNQVKNARLDREAQKLYVMLNQAKQVAVSERRASFACITTTLTTLSCVPAGSSLDWGDNRFIYAATPGLPLPTPTANLSNMAYQDINTSLSNVEKRQMVLRTLEASPATISYTSNRAEKVFGFSASGRPINDTPFRVAICDDRDSPEDFGKYVEVNPIGRLLIRNTGTEAGDVACDGDVVS